MTRSISQRQIPTFLGVAILAIALVVGVVFLPKGFEAFAPRAAPESTPKSMQISNIRDTGFSVSFVTDTATSGFIKYGTDQSNLRLQASDDRDQTSGQVGQYITHHITVRDLQPNTQYYFTTGTGGTPVFDNAGKPFEVKTAQKGGTPSSAKTIYGNIVDSGNAAVSGAIVYVNISGASTLSTLSKDSGSWAIPLSTARTADGSQFLTVANSTQLAISVVGPVSATSGAANLTVETAQPAPPIALTSGDVNLANTDTTNSGALSASANDTAVVIPPVNPEAVAEVTATPAASVAPTASVSATQVNVDAVSPPTVQTSQPVITGQAAPGAQVTIQIHSETEINGVVQADQNGAYSFDISTYAQGQHLEPGQHTATVSYVDPATGQTKTVTQTFYVMDDGSVQASQGSTGNSSLLAAALPSPTPFGTSNPFVIPSPSPVPSPTVTATATPAATLAPRTSMPATSSALPQSGSTGTTSVLLITGGIFILLGTWIFIQKPHIRSVEQSSEA